MKRLRLFLLCLLFFSLFALPNVTTAQSLRFTVPVSEVEAYLEEDGTLSLYYVIEFENSPNGALIDYVDVGMPSSSYSLKNIQAEIDGMPIKIIESSPYVANGFALGLEENSIQPGDHGQVTAWVSGVKDVLYPFEDAENYASFLFSPNYFGSEYDKSTNTEYRVTIILPPGVGDEEGIYYYPKNWPGNQEPDDVGRTLADDRVYYSWYTNTANAHTEYRFGAAYPDTYVPENAIAKKAEYIPPTQPGTTGGSGTIGNIIRTISGNICCFGSFFFIFATFVWSIYQSTVGSKKRKMDYLPPKMKIEGHGIKRGLTAVEAAILMGQPMDKILTMILFGTIKKEAATVITQDPLSIEVADPLPEGLHPYETEFLEAFTQPKSQQRGALQKVMTNLVNGVSSKMKGFSRKETLAYYEDIMRKAWQMVEQAQTPEVKSENYNQTLEWTMLDENYQDRTRRTFSSGPVFVPIWWSRYSPSYRQSVGGSVSTTGQSIPSTGQATGGGKVSLPHIPGSDFAANVINGATGMAAGVVGNLTTFTSGVTSRTNPIPVTTSRSSGSGGFRGGGGGSSCACACACAGCACACAGGGR